MKKLFFIIAASITFSNIEAQQPEKIYSIAKVDKPHEYYVQQAELWWKAIEKDKTNEDAWYKLLQGKTATVALLTKG